MRYGCFILFNLTMTPGTESYPVDVHPAQIVRWFKAELAVAPRSFRVTATRRQEGRELPVGKETHFGDEERQDLTEVATIATLEIAPLHASDGWLLRITVADEAGPRIPDRGVPNGREQQIDIGTFQKEFIRPERGIADVTAEVDSPAAKARVTRLLNAIMRNSHRPGRHMAHY
jgi:hypothetical protein